MEQKIGLNTSINTNTLLRRLFKTNNLDRFLEEHKSEFHVERFDELISGMCIERKVSAESIINKSGIERTYGHQLFNGTRKPSRDKVIQLAIGFELNVDETQKLLRTANKSLLYPRIERDAIIAFGISKEYGIMKIQRMLEEKGATILGGSSRYEENS